MDSIKTVTPAELPYKIVANDLRTTNFELKYTIPRTQFKNITINGKKDWDEIVKHTVSKGQAKLVMREMKPYVEGDDDVPLSDDKEGSLKKKKKTGPSPEETEMDKIIANLQEKYQCEDRLCKKDICWPDAVNGEHIHLTFMHLRVWSSAVQAKVEGVTLDTPPNSKIFDTANCSNDDLGIISCQRNALGTQNTNSPNITFSLAGLPELLGLNPIQNCHPPAAPTCVSC